MSRNENPDLEGLEGWLYKQKSHIKLTYFMPTQVRRWFKVRRLSYAPTLCYYESHRSREERGSFQLNEVRRISDDGKCFTLSTCSRNLTLIADTPAEHKRWLKGLLYLCPSADCNNIISSLTFREVTIPAKPTHDDCLTVSTSSGRKSTSSSIRSSTSQSHLVDSSQTGEDDNISVHFHNELVGFFKKNEDFTTATKDNASFTATRIIPPPPTCPPPAMLTPYRLSPPMRLETENLATLPQSLGRVLPPLPVDSPPKVLYSSARDVKARDN